MPDCNTQCALPSDFGNSDACDTYGVQYMESGHYEWQKLSCNAATFQQQGTPTCEQNNWCSVECEITSSHPDYTGLNGTVKSCSWIRNDPYVINICDTPQCE